MKIMRSKISIGETEGLVFDVVYCNWRQKILIIQSLHMPEQLIHNRYSRQELNQS